MSPIDLGARINAPHYARRLWLLQRLASIYAKAGRSLDFDRTMDRIVRLASTGRLALRSWERVQRRHHAATLDSFGAFVRGGRAA